MNDSHLVELVCSRHRSKKDGVMRLHWSTGFKATITKQGDKCTVTDDNLKETHRMMKRLLPALGMFKDFYDSESPIEGALASVIFIADDSESGHGLSRIVQSLKDDYRRRYPDQWEAKYKNGH